MHGDKAGGQNLQGHLALVLHAHLPFIRHPEHNEFLEEDWFFEALSETYIPLLLTFQRLREQRVDFRLSMVFSPTLVAMLSDALLRRRYVRYLDRRIELAEKETVRTRGDERFQSLARMYREHFVRCRRVFVDVNNCDLLSAYADLWSTGHVELMTCGATHGFLPLMEPHPEAIRAQVRVAVQEHERHFGRKPTGFWLPECAYTPVAGNFLRDEGIRFVIVDSHGLTNARPRPRFGVYAPIVTPSGVSAFGRDIESSRQVWSANEGYPGDPSYREFYRDIGYDLDYDYIRPYIQPTGARKNTGIKYHRITGREDSLDGAKQPYEPHLATERAAEHAGNFMFNRERQVAWLRQQLGRPPVVVAPYDAELFGHWWWEGPQFLDFFLRKTASEQDVFALTTPVEYLRDNPTQQLAAPGMSSWGDQGYAQVWLNEKNDWIYPHLHMAEERMIQLARDNADVEAGSLVERALAQAARELLLAQASDWAFIINGGTAVAYAEKRIRDHITRFTRLWEQVNGGEIDVAALRALEERDNLFPDLDFRVYL